ncbi:MAG TPA: hypothetical protein VEC36_03485, partial [Patescibacteria group bacterium]|nr:hypothetical protein [Patescibacteria group bacterium]
LREIDFEDIYSVTLQRILFRNPWGLHSMAVEEPDEEGNYPDSVDVFLWLGQGATMDFPTRTRKVFLKGYANPFEIRVTDFNDSVFTLPLDVYPRTIYSSIGIKRIQLLGTDGNGNDDINWSGGLLEVTTFDENGDTLAHTNFDKLEPDKYYLIGNAFEAHSFESDTSMLNPVKWHGVTFHEPDFGFAGTHLSYFNSRVDPDNPIGNLALELNHNAAISFPEGVEGALLTVETVHERDTFLFETTDYADNIDTVMETGWGRAYDTTWVEDQRSTFFHIGFGSPHGIRQIRVLDGWGLEIRNNEDLGEPNDTTYLLRTVMLSALHLAETVPTELFAVKNTVDELNQTGYVGTAEAGQLKNSLVSARTQVENNQNSSAIATLNSFKTDVQNFLKISVLVPEEAQEFLKDATYIISRLGGATSVEDFTTESFKNVRFENISQTADGMEVRFTAPAASEPVIKIYNVQGELLNVLKTSGNAIHWNFHDTAGYTLPTGSYVITLSAAGETATQLVQILQ